MLGLGRPVPPPSLPNTTGARRHGRASSQHKHYRAEALRTASTTGATGDARVNLKMKRSREKAQEALLFATLAETPQDLNLHNRQFQAMAALCQSNNLHDACPIPSPPELQSQVFSSSDHKENKLENTPRPETHAPPGRTTGTGAVTPQRRTWIIKLRYFTPSPDGFSILATSTLPRHPSSPYPWGRRSG